MSNINTKIPEKKKVTISSKRQFTIPQLYYSLLGFEREAECIMGDGMLIIRPISSNKDYSEKILKDLINEGYSGNELLNEFMVRKSKLNPNIDAMKEAARYTTKVDDVVQDDIDLSERENMTILNDLDSTNGISDDEMTNLFKESIRIDNEIRRIKGLPIAKFDDEKGEAYMEYPDGRREYVED